MPLDKSVVELIGTSCSLVPNEGGYVSGFVSDENQVLWLDNLGAFRISLIDVILHKGIYRGAIGKLSVLINGINFTYCGVLVRSDDCIDLRVRSVACNFVLSDESPFINDSLEFSSPEFMVATHYPFVKGVARVALSKEL
jgi:hypothetical protein